ncbi:DNA helicase MCM9, putative [Plasmodium chabaudi chabaudi]|uniref:DNA helicase MCM9, putative n=1 Tax=Plasmodium chabaudi chabaudi TaxID=31271 RepID=A0A4V0K654_PLACU|nr:DNA helicase MCM9, putative [Plasmodium chabaudi chabaudi]VTZ68144.1 DNA helicase MCM9, putative [Plasmodium chabaudi chabaudi]|eukprot:XP_737463.2 DNA helicase MCM9, putative [Plasmodium chabaudi chabaudi]
MSLSSSDSSIFSDTDYGGSSEEDGDITNREETIENVKFYNKILIKLFLKNKKYYEQIKAIALNYISKLEDIEFFNVEKVIEERNDHIYNFYFDTYDAIEYGENKLIYYIQNDFHKFIDVINNYSIPFFFRLIFLSCYFEVLRNEEILRRNTSKKNQKKQTYKETNLEHSKIGEPDQSNEMIKIMNSNSIDNLIMAAENDMKNSEKETDTYNEGKESQELGQSKLSDDGKLQKPTPPTEDEKKGIHFYDFIDYEFNKDKQLMEEIDLYSACLMKGILYSYKSYEFLRDSNIKSKINNCLKIIFDKHNIKLKCRIVNVPFLHNMHINNLQEIESNKYIGKFISTEGIITRVGEKKILEEYKKYRCMSCDHIIKKKAIPELYYNTQPVIKCQNIINTNSDPHKVDIMLYKNIIKGKGKDKVIGKGGVEKKGNYNRNKFSMKFKVRKNSMDDNNIQPGMVSQKLCNKTNFEFLENEVQRVDYQEIKIKETSNANIPFSITVVVLENLVGKHYPGKKVIINGIILRRWKRLYRDIRCDTELFIEANNIEVNELGNSKGNEILIDNDFTKSVHSLLDESEACSKWKRLDQENAIQGMPLEKENYEQKSQTDHYRTGSTLVRDMHITGTRSQNRGIEQEINIFEKYWSAFKDNKIEGKKNICESVCPNLYNCKISKLSVLLVLIGGNKINEFDSFYAENNRWKKYFNRDEENEESDDSNFHDDLAKRDEAKDRFLDDDNIYMKQNGGKKKNKNNVLYDGLKRKGGKRSKKMIKEVSVDNYHKRSLCHLLLVGNPGTGKSQLLKEIKNLTNICTNVSGMFCTTAGLTCAAIKEGNNFMLESGALVLADNGVCCIDEFCLMKTENKNAIHEAMEQLSISIAKAGIVDKLNCRCTIIGASNFEIHKNMNGTIDKCQDQVLIINLSYALLSRFDLVVITEDSDETDARVADCVLRQGEDGTNFENKNEHDKEKIIDHEKPNGAKIIHLENSENEELAKYANFEKKNSEQARNFSATKKKKITWPSEKLKEYIYYLKNNFFPNFTKSSKLILITYYSHLRKYNNGDNGTTIRSLESLIRLSEAHSKLMYNSIVTTDDVINIILLVELSLRSYKIGIKINGNNNILIAKTGIIENLKQILLTYNQDNHTFKLLDDVLFDKSLYNYFKSVILNKLGLSEQDGVVHSGLQ